jgi:hypothetical protein
MLKQVVSELVFNHLKCPVPGTILAFQKFLLKSYISGAVYFSQMNHISYSFGCSQNYCHRPGPARSVLGSLETILSIGNTRNCGGYYCFQDTINCSWNFPSFQLLYQWGGYGPRNRNFRVLRCCSRNDPFMLPFQLDHKHRFQVYFLDTFYLFCCWYEPFPKCFGPTETSLFPEWLAQESRGFGQVLVGIG